LIVSDLIKLMRWCI